MKDYFWGTISFDNCKSKRVFTESEVNILRSWGLLIIGAMQRGMIAHNLQAISSNYKGLMWSVDTNGIITSLQGRYMNLVPDAQNMEGANYKKFQ